MKSDSLTEHLKRAVQKKISFIKEEARKLRDLCLDGSKRFVDENEKTAVITFHNAKVIPNTIVNMERELRQKHRMRQNSIGKWFRFWLQC